METFWWVLGTVVYLAGGAYTLLAALRFTAYCGGEWGSAILFGLFWPLCLPMMWATWRPGTGKGVPKIAMHKIFDRWD